MMHRSSHRGSVAVAGLIAIALLVPRAAVAQSTAPTALPSAAPASSQPPSSVGVRASGASGAAAPVSGPVRGVLETLVGVALGTLGGIASVPIAIGIAPSYLSGVIGVSIGAGLGVTLGVWATGAALGGRGAGWAVFSGAMFGATVAAVAQYGLIDLCFNSCSQPGESAALWIALITSVTLPVLGGVLGYELSSRRAGQSAHSRITMVPLLTRLPDGGQMFGVAGSF